MNRILTVTLLLICSTALTVSAQSAEPQQPAAGARLWSSVITSATAVAAAEQAKPQPPPQPQRQPPPPPPQRPDRVREGSMVGYIEDPIISSKFRLRYEGAWNNPTPDRAEFFYAKCGCYSDPSLAATPLYDAESPGPQPGAAADVNFTQLLFMGEYAASDRLSVFAELPVRWLQPQSFIPGTGAGFEDQAGVGDIKIGAKFGSAKPGQALTGQLKLYMPTGESADGMGTDHWSIEPAFLFYRDLSEIATVEGQLALWLPFSGSNGLPASIDEKFSGQVLSYGIGPSITVYRTDTLRLAPVVELVGWHVFGGFQTDPDNLTAVVQGVEPPGADSDTVNIKFGGRVSWTGSSPATSGSIYVGYGKAMTDAKWYDDILRVEYRMGF